MKQARANREEIKLDASEELTFSDLGEKASADLQASANGTPHISTETRETMLATKSGKLNTEEEEEKKETN